MIKPEQISDEAAEAAARADHAAWLAAVAVDGCDTGLYPQWEDLPEERRVKTLARARAVLAAGLDAWPGAEVHNFDGWTHAEGLVLPLPQEVRDE